MLDLIFAVCFVGFCVALTVPIARFLWFMVNRDPDAPAVAQWEREHRAMSKRDRRHIREAISHGQPVTEPRLTEAAAKGAQVVHSFRQECLAATHIQRWASIAGLFATGAAMARTLQHSGAGVEGWIWIGVCALLLLRPAGRWTIRLLRSIRANRNPGRET